jgi:hypothetical protein
MVAHYRCFTKAVWGDSATTSTAAQLVGRWPRSSPLPCCSCVPTHHCYADAEQHPVAGPADSRGLGPCAFAQARHEA